MAPSDWASLPSDLVRRVADLFLPTSDLDYYMSLRAVCRDWRAAAEDPCGPDPRFSPRGWVLITSLAGDDQTGRRYLFLHVDTGRLRWKNMSILRDYTWVASSEDGHLVLEPVSRNSRICLLNPITGRLVCFPVTTAQFRGDNKLGLGHGRRMFAASSSPMILYSLFDSSSGGCIDPTWDVVYNRESLFRTTQALGRFVSMMPFKGRAYALNSSGSVAVLEHNCRLDEKPELTKVVTGDFTWIDARREFLVDNAGEMLLVRQLASCVQVFRVDVENRLLSQIKSIGNRAIFLGGHRCLSVNACNLPGIEGNSIYYFGTGIDKGMYAHCLNEESHNKLTESIVRKGYVYSPKSLARVLMEYVCHDKCDVGSMTIL